MINCIGVCPINESTTGLIVFAIVCLIIGVPIILAFIGDKYKEHNYERHPEWNYKVPPPNEEELSGMQKLCKRQAEKLLDDDSRC